MAREVRDEPAGRVLRPKVLVSPDRTRSHGLRARVRAADRPHVGPQEAEEQRPGVMELPRRGRVDGEGPAIEHPRTAIGGSHVGVVPEHQPARACSLDHPHQRDVSEFGVLVAPTDIAVVTAEPDLLDPLFPGIGLQLPQSRLERLPLLVDGQCLEGGVDLRAQLGVVEFKAAVGQLGQAQSGRRDPERPHRVPDPDEADSRFVAVGTPEQLRLDVAGVEAP